MHDDYNEERIDEIIPRIIEEMERRAKSMTNRELLEAIVKKQGQIIELKRMWDTLMRQANEIEKKSEQTVKEFQDLLERAKIVSEDISPDEIIEGK